MIMIAKATAKFIRVPPRKAREVIDLIRGKDVSRALAAVECCPKKAAVYIKKVLQSAVANARAGKKVEVERLYIAAATVDAGPVLKRFIPRAMGRATPITKRMSHITIELAEREEEGLAAGNSRRTKRSSRKKQSKEKT